MQIQFLNDFELPEFYYNNKNIFNIILTLYNTILYKQLPI